jgi:hypothetical protein
MRNIRFVFLMVFVFCAMSVFAQKFSVTSIDPSGYPQISVGVTVLEKAEATQQDFKVYEEAKNVNFTFLKNSAGSPATGGKAICFLIEASGHTYGAPVDNFRKAVISALSAMGVDDKVDVCYFGKANSDGKSLNVLSAEFTSDKDILKNEINSKIVAARDTNRVADVFKSIYECLDFINSKKDLPSTKILIVLSAAINNSKSPIKSDDCIDKATKFNIPVYTITYKTSNRYAADNFVRISDKTNAKSVSAKSVSDITTGITDFMADADKNAVTPDNSYTLTFMSTQSADSNRFEIEYKGEKQNAAYAIPEGKASFWKKYIIIIIVVALLLLALVAVVVFLVMRSGKKKKVENDRLKSIEDRNMQLQDQLRQSKESKTVVTPKEPQKFDLKRTMIGGGGGSPMLLVSAANFSKNFPLNKQKLTIGRTNSNDIMIPEQTVSSNHASLVNEGGNWFIVDNNSTNGTFVNGTRVSRQKLNNNDTIKLGAANLKIQF